MFMCGEPPTPTQLLEPSGTVPQKKCYTRFYGYVSDLVSILSKEENEFVSQKVVEFDYSSTDYSYPWIGLQLQKRRTKGKIYKYFNYTGGVIMAY